MIEVENTDVNIVRNLIPMRNLMPGERLWSESHFRLVYTDIYEYLIPFDQIKNS